jgi:hypothetical protein
LLFITDWAIKISDNPQPERKTLFMATASSTVGAILNKFASAHDDIIALYVFGSVATGRSRPSSDLDIAIMSRRQISGDERIALETELSNMLGRDVDLAVFSQSGALLQHQILKNGRLVYESDSRERVRQEVSARSEYLDTRFLYKELRDTAHG